jgi:hypothetical protein
MGWSGLPEKIEKYIIPEPMSGCWIWMGGVRDKKDLYGGCEYEGKIYRTHRLTYILLRGSIAPDLHIDHLCRNRICCNPDHLEPVTQKINVHRGEGVAARNMVKTRCPQGHEYTEENLYVWNNQRFCRTCSAGYKARYAERKLVARILWDPTDEYY